jgi:hypothetical protein
MRRTVTVMLGDFSADSLQAGRGGDQTSLPRTLMQAIRYYLAERDSGRPTWPCPDFRREGPEPASDGPVEVEVSLDDTAWKAFREEAERQAVSVNRLAEHAALYFAADWDSGLLSRRILDELAGEET